MYRYENQRASLFTEDGSVMYSKIRDTTKRLLQEAGAARMQEMMKSCSGESWTMLACADRMVELGEIREITTSAVPGQHRVFVAARE